MSVFLIWSSSACNYAFRLLRLCSEDNQDFDASILRSINHCDATGGRSASWLKLHYLAQKPECRRRNIFNLWRLFCQELPWISLRLLPMPGLGEDLSDQFTSSDKLAGAPPVLVRFVCKGISLISAPNNLWVIPLTYKMLHEECSCDPVMLFKVSWRWGYSTNITAARKYSTYPLNWPKIDILDWKYHGLRIDTVPW
jgi:hypothetical protein